MRALTPTQQDYVASHLGIVHSTINRYFSSRQEADREDLFSEGVLALIYAVLTYDEARGSFDSYVFPCVRAALWRAVSRPVPPPLDPYDLDRCVSRSSHRGHLSEILCDLPARSRDILEDWTFLQPQRALATLWRTHRLPESRVHGEYMSLLESLRNTLEDSAFAA